MEPEPIPLRTLTVLLNYERVISDPRFMGVRLLKSSLADSGIIGRMKSNYPSLLKDVPKTVEKTSFNIFEPYTEPATANPPSTICSIHPKAEANVKALSHTQRELAYYETRGHDGCFKALGLYQFFFEHCQTEQRISIQLANEVIELKIHGPKQNSIASIPSAPLMLHTGKEDESHAVLAFINPQNRDKCFVVDMSRLQYGEAGRGLNGENYFIGTKDQIYESMKKVCVEIRTVGIYPTLGTTGSANEVRLRAAAKKVWERWQNRVTERWCNFCGKPGPNLRSCPGCKDEKIGYCCVEHQKADWKLHKHTCEKNRK